MSLPTFDATKHHISLGPSGGADYGFFIDGSYQRSAQRLGSPTEFGGERDLIAPSVLSRWTQDDFSGGVYQEMWGADAAMFYRSENILPSLIERSVRSCPPLVAWANPGSIDARLAVAIFASGGYVVVAEPTQSKHYHFETGAVSTVSHSAREIVVAAHDPLDNYVYAACEGSGSDNNYVLRRFKADGTLATIGQIPEGNPSGPQGIEMAGRDLVLSMGGTLYLCDVNDARTSTRFTRVGRLPGRWRDSVAYNGLVYILCSDSEQRTSLVAWDGSTVLPVVDFPFNFVGRCITVYGGRLFVGGGGADVTGTDRYAELYEITGASLRLVRSFSDDARAGRTSPATFYDLCVHEGLLFCGSDLHYLVAYDLTRDALFGGPNIIPDPSDRSVYTKFLLSTRERLFAWCEDGAGSGAGSADGFYRWPSVAADLSDDPTTAVTSYDAIVETSDFAPEPDRDKRWSSLRVLTRLATPGTAGVDASYSVDGGDSWTALTATDTVDGAFTQSDFDLSGVPLSKVIRFRLTATKTDLTFTEVIALTCNFLFLDSGKRAWQFSVNGAEKIEALDLTTITQDVLEIDQTLWEWWEDKQLLDFTDLDGVVRKVIVSDIGDAKPYVGNKLADGSREGFYSLVLTEV
jgi:hypothetical protein